MTHSRDRIGNELLVLACQEGKSEAFRRLVEHWQERLWRHAFRLTGRDDAAWDVLQEAWLAIANGIGKLQEPARFPAWAYTIVTRRAADWVAGVVRREGREEDPRATLLEEQAAPEPEADGAVQLLRRALRRLPREQRVLLSLHYVDGFGVREMGTILDVPEGTVKSRLHHARSQLRDIIERIDR